MKILLGHCFYRSSAPSGEDVVYRNERSLLESHGIKVIPFERYNDDINDSDLSSRLRLAFSTSWSRQSYKAISEVIRQEQPDIAHFHNTFPQMSPSVYAACKRFNVPVIQTLHNYRLICPGALLQRNGHPCEDCIGTSLLPAIHHRCYRDSLAATGALTSMLVYNRIRGSYQRNVDSYIALTDFAVSRLKAGGLPKDKIHVKPNFLPDPPEPGLGQGGYAVFVGRLSSEKGILTLIKAWAGLKDIPLKILGNGPLMGQLTEIVRSASLPVELLGSVARTRVIEIVRDAALQIVPSECYEGFPLVVLEAYACGTPVLASRIGSLDEIVLEGITGLKFTAGNAEDLTNTIRSLWTDNEKLRSYRTNARRQFDKNYTAQINLNELLAIYKKARSADSF